MKKEMTVHGKLEIKWRNQEKQHYQIKSERNMDDRTFNYLTRPKYITKIELPWEAIFGKLLIYCGVFMHPFIEYD